MKKNSWCSILIVLRGGLPIYCLPQIFNKSLSLAGLHSSFVYCQLQLRVRVGPLGAVTLPHGKMLIICQGERLRDTNLDN